jgi:L-malate glycosyltransferase
MTSVIHCGIPITDLQVTKNDKNRERRVLKGRKFPIIGMVGELWKNQEEMIDAGVSLCAELPDITIAIVGGGGTEHLTKKIAAYGLEKNFLLTGRIPREQIPDLFYDLDLSVSTHRNEGFGIVHIESLAARTPVIAYNNGGLVEIIRNGGGILVNGGTEDFTREIIGLLNDDERRFALGEEGRIVIEKNFTLDMMVKRHVEYFQKLMS